MRKVRALLFAAAVFAQAAYGQWQVVSSNTEPSAAAGVEHRHIVLRDAASNDDATIDLAIFSAAKATVRVIDNAGASDYLADAMTREKCVAGANGGYFDPDFKPIGLRVINGATVSPLTRARLLTGVLAASTRGIQIMRVGEISPRRKLTAAIECGPLLLDHGVPVAGLDDKRSARRTFVATSGKGTSALGNSSDLTLAQLASVLADRSLANDLVISRALNLDGGSSCAFWFRKNDGSVFSISEDKRVRDFIGVIAR